MRRLFGGRGGRRSNTLAIVIVVAVVVNEHGVLHPKLGESGSGSVVIVVHPDYVAVAEVVLLVAEVVLLVLLVLSRSTRLSTIGSSRVPARRLR